MVKRIVCMSLPSPWKSPDNITWDLSSDGSFSIKTFYLSLDDAPVELARIFRMHLNCLDLVGAHHKRNPRSDLLISWKPPQEHFIKLNVDGSYFRNNNHAVCGGVFCYHLGRFLKTFSCNIGSCSITHTKLWDIIRGLQIAAANHLSNIVLEFDSQAAINLVKKGSASSHPCYPLLEDIRIVADRRKNLSWRHTSREANNVADLLAKKGQELPHGVHIFDIQQALFLDACGVPRLKSG
ncbi:hypothetical protein AHAS_Ahas06G0256000 [Arachis hypogaea]